MLFPKWVWFGLVNEKELPLLKSWIHPCYHILLNNGRQRHCHQDQLLLRVIETNPLNKFDEATILMHLSILVSSIENHLQLLRLTHTPLTK